MRSQGSPAERLDDALRAVADETRREILRLVASEERSAGAIAANFSISRPAISQHLRVLCDAGLVEVRPEGTRRWYRARPEALAELQAALDAMWTDRLGHLGRAAERADWPARARRSRAHHDDGEHPDDRAHDRSHDRSHD